MDRREKPCFQYPVHLLFLSHYFPPEVNAPANRTFEHARRLVNRGFNITIITNHPNHPRGVIFEGHSNVWTKVETLEGIRIIRVKTYLAANKGIIKRILNYVFFMFMAIQMSFKVKNFDLVFATSPQFFCGIAGAIISKIRRKPFILEIRDLWPDSIIAVGAMRNRSIIKLLRFVERWMYYSADRICTVTRTLKERIENMRYPQKSISVIYNGVDLSRFNSDISVDESNWEFSYRFLVAYIGTFGLAHRLETILQVASMFEVQYPDIGFILVGDGAERDTLVDLKEKMKLRQLHILPLQKRKSILAILRQTTVGLVMLKNDPLFRSAIPSKTFEYMSMKIPVIFSAPEGEGSRLIEKLNCGIVVKPENVQSVYNAIKLLYDNPSYVKQLGEAGFKAVVSKFNRDKSAELLANLIQSTLENQVR